MRIVALSLALSLPAVAFAETPEEKGLRIAKQVDKANEGFKSEVSDMTMDLINAHGDVVKRKMSTNVLEGDDDGDRSVVAFSAPADVNGTKLLTWAHKTKTDDQWLFMPAIKRIKRISARSRSGSFMGSEFSYEDLGSQEVEKYTYKFLREEKVDGRPCWVMERFPTDKKSGYKRMITWTDQGYNAVVKIEYFDRKNELLKIGTFSGYAQHGKYWRVGKIEMSNVQTKKRSILAWKSRKLGADVDEEDFEPEALED